MSTKRSLISHLDRHVIPAKQCASCRRDIGREWRTKTPDGKYYCHPCLYAMQEVLRRDQFGLFAGSAPLPAFESALKLNH